MSRMKLLRLVKFNYQTVILIVFVCRSKVCCVKILALPIILYHSAFASKEMFIYYLRKTLSFFPFTFAGYWICHSSSIILTGKKRLLPVHICILYVQCCILEKFVSDHCVFREAISFPREENCELWGTGNVQGQISKHTCINSWAKWGLFFLLSFKYFFQVVWFGKLGNITWVFLGE